MPPSLSADDQRGGAFRLLARNRDFRHLFLAQVVMFGGDWFVLIPLLALLPELTGTGMWSGLVLAADTGVLALLLPFAGTVADRVDRRVVLIAANVTSMVAVLALLTVRSAATAPLALGAIAVVAVAKAFYSPASQAALPNVVEPADLPAANALAGSVWGTMLVVAASLGGVLGALLGPYVCFGIGAGCLAAAATLTTRVRQPLQATQQPAARLRTFAALGESLRYVGRHPRVLSLVTVKSAVGLGNGVMAVFPVLATTVFGVGAWGMGLLFAARGVGALLGPMVLRRILVKDRLLPGLAISMATYGVAYLLVGASPWFALVLVLVAVAHFAGGSNWALSNYALQGAVPDQLRGRVFSTDMMLATLAISASQLTTGLLVDHVNPRYLVMGCAALTFGYAVVWRLATLRLRGAEAGPATTS